VEGWREIDTQREGFARAPGGRESENQGPGWRPRWPSNARHRETHNGGRGGSIPIDADLLIVGGVRRPGSRKKRCFGEFERQGVGSGGGGGETRPKTRRGVVGERDLLPTLRRRTLGMTFLMCQ